MRNTTSCQWSYLGRIGYQEAWDFQRSLAQALTQGNTSDTLLLLEHPPTYTLGRRSKPSDLLLPREALEARGAQVVDVDRGGEITFHGPGQLVGYPIIDIRPWGGPLRYVRGLEAALVGALDAFGIQAACIDGLTGVWAAGAKIAAIGVKISRGVATHGFAINVTTDLSWFEHIVPCGIHDRDVTSMERVLGRPVALEEVASVVAERFGRDLGFRMTQATPDAIAGIALLTATA